MDSIERVPLPVETLAPDGRTNAYLVGREGAVLVDPAALTDELDRAAEHRGVRHVLATHAHPDHVGAVAAYADRFDATVWARAGRTARFERATGVSPDRTFAEGTTIETGSGERVAVVETPGHAPDHVALAVPGPGGPDVLAGDLVVAAGSVLVGADEGDMRAYLTSLRRLYARDPSRLLPGHGPVVDDPRATVERLLCHRLRRERRVRAAVEDGARTAAAVTDAAYEKDLAGVRRYAERTVAAHLEKLAVEGAVVWDGERATPR